MIEFFIDFISKLEEMFLDMVGGGFWFKLMNFYFYKKSYVIINY